MMIDQQQQQQQQQQQYDASSERLSILAQAVRVAMVLEAGSSVSKENTNFPFIVESAVAL